MNDFKPIWDVFHKPTEFNKPMNKFEQFLEFWEANRPDYMIIARDTLYRIWLAKEGEFTKSDIQVFNRAYTWWHRVNEGGDPTNLDNLDQ